MKKKKERERGKKKETVKSKTKSFLKWWIKYKVPKDEDIKLKIR